MKTNALKLIVTLFVTMISLGFISCGNEEDDNIKNSGLKGEGVITTQVWNNGYSYANLYGVGNLSIDEFNEFHPYCSQYLGNIGIVCVGKIPNPTQLAYNLKEGWSNASFVIPGYYYLVRFNYSNSEDCVFALVYVVEHIVSSDGNLVGAIIQYKSPFLFINGSATNK